MFDFIIDSIENIKPLLISTLVVFLAVGVYFLVKFCDIFVDNACLLAKKMKISRKNMLTKKITYGILFLPRYAGLFLRA